MQNTLFDHIERARELYRLDKYTLALAELDLAAAADPTSPEPSILRAWIYRVLRQMDAAEAAARHALTLDPLETDAHHTLGVVLWDRGKIKEAEAAFKEALTEITWSSYMHLSNYARFLIALNRADEALIHADRAVSLIPTEAAPHISRAMALYTLDRLDEAELAAREALRLDPHAPIAFEYLGKVALKQRRYGDAEEHFRSQLHLTPSDPDGRAGLVTALKARHPIYAAVLGLTLRTANFTTRRVGRWYAVSMLVLFVLMLFSVRVNEQVTAILLATLGLMLYALFFFFILRWLWQWLGEPVFNTLLVLDHANRAVIEYDNADAATTLAIAAFAACLLLFGVGLVWGSGTEPGVWGGFLLMVVIGGGFGAWQIRTAHGRTRTVFWVLYGLFLLGTLLMAFGLLFDGNDYGEVIGAIGALFLFGGVLLGIALLVLSQGLLLLKRIVMAAGSLLDRPRD